MKSSVRTILLLALILIGAGIAVDLAYTYLSGPSTTPTAEFTVIISNDGFNGSKNYYNASDPSSNPWPIMSVHLGDRVKIHIVNDDTVEPHGFAITHYLDGGVTIRANQSVDVIFTADQAGTFRVYCNIVCSIHVYMQNGRLIVSSS